MVAFLFCYIGFLFTADRNTAEIYTTDLRDYEIEPTGNTVTVKTLEGDVETETRYPELADKEKLKLFDRQAPTGSSESRRVESLQNLVDSFSKMPPRPSYAPRNVAPWMRNTIINARLTEMETNLINLKKDYRNSVISEWLRDKIEFFMRVTSAIWSLDRIFIMRYLDIADEIYTVLEKLASIKHHSSIIPDSDVMKDVETALYDFGKLVFERVKR